MPKLTPKTARRSTLDLSGSKKYKSPLLYKEFFAGINKKLLQNKESLDINELNYLLCYLELLQKLHIPFVESISSNPYLTNRINIIKEKQVVSLNEIEPLNTIIGPKIDRGPKFEDFQLIGEQVCAQTISTYPKRSELVRQGDPICDRYGISIYENRTVCVLADGCNWGERPKQAAEKTRDCVLKFLNNNISQINSIENAQSYLLRSFVEAQRIICIDDPEGPGLGSTTLLAGIILEIQCDNANMNEWVFVCASVGDCKAFLIEHDTLKIRDITLDNRTALTSDTDCGGRLGCVKNETADLRNLRTYCLVCQPTDLILVVSDGIHDNLHPEMLSVSPLDLKLDFNSWKEASKVIDTEKIASKYRVEFLQRFLADFDNTPKNIVSKLIEHCTEITKASREWMENNIGQPLPTDYRKYPGKMDHTTCIVFRVGYASWYTKKKVLLQDSINTKHIPLSVTLYKTSSYLRICCRTIAKGKFDCLATPFSCILKIIPETSFKLSDDEEILEYDEISQDIIREVKFPNNIKIDIHSKKIWYESSTSIISLQFSLVN